MSKNHLIFFYGVFCRIVLMFENEQVVHRPATEVLVWLYNSYKEQFVEQKFSQQYF